MKAKRTEAVRGKKERRRVPEGATARRSGEAPPRGRKPAREQRPTRSAPRTNPFPRPTDAPARPKNAAQAKLTKAYIGYIASDIGQKITAKNAGSAPIPASMLSSNQKSLALVK